MSFLEFKKIGHEDMKLIFSYLQKEPGRTTDFSYGGILMWVDYFKYEYAIYKDTLFIKGVLEDNINVPAFSLPIGNLSLKDSIAILKDYSKEIKIPLELSAVPEYALENLKELQPKEVLPLDHWGDYLYSIEDLSSLKGKKLSKKRNHVNHFMAEFPEWEMRDIDSSNLEEVNKFLDQYESENHDSFMAKEESLLTRQLLQLIAEGDPELKGAALYNVPGNICAITIGDLKGDTLFIHVEKGSRSVSGCYEMINKQFANRIYALNPHLKFINREDDGGEEGIQNAKLSYHPLEILRKFNVVF